MGNPQNSRVLKHSVSCIHLRDYDRLLFDHVNKVAASASLGARLQAPAAAADSISIDQLAATGSSGLITPQGTLNVTTLRAEGAKSKAQSQQKFQEEVDLIIMRLICVRGLVPNIIDSPEWNELMQKLNGVYKPTCADVFRDQYIPQEAAFVRNSQVELLQKEENLTLTFDGTTTRNQESFYTAHATTPARNTYFLDGHQGTGEHHNAAWIMDRLLEVCSLCKRESLQELE